MITVTALTIYPVKGLRGISLSTSPVLATGLRYDRQWLLIDENDRFLTQRENEALARIDVAVEANGLVLSCENLASIHVPVIDGERRNVQIWKDQVDALDQGDEVALWLQQALNKPAVRLVKFASDARRPVKADHLNGAESDVGFADGYPFLFANEQTLTALNAQLEHAVPMNRFRPNITIAGPMALEEHVLKGVSRADDLAFSFVEPCQRCKVTTIDQVTGVVAENREPLRTLVNLNPFPDKRGGFFGQNAILACGAGAEIHVGDTLEIVS